MSSDTLEGFDYHTIGYKYSHHDPEIARRGSYPSLKNARGSISAAKEQEKIEEPSLSTLETHVQNDVTNLCTVSGASIPLTQLCLPRFFKPSRTFLERNGSYNFKANSSHSYETIKTTPKMSDDTGSNGTHATEPREYPPIRPREQRKAYLRMLNKVTEDIRSLITEEDLHKIFSAPMEKRSSLTSTVNSPDIVWEYVPREQDGLSIPLS